MDEAESISASDPGEPAGRVTAEFGGPVQEFALPDQGRLRVERRGVVLEGSTPAVVLGVAVLGVVVIVVRGHDLVPELAGIAAVVGLTIAVLIVVRLGYREASGRVSRKPAGARRRNRSRAGERTSRARSR